jgi:hypothetical protein
MVIREHAMPNSGFLKLNLCQIQAKPQRGL